jgi:hypothetical protein
MPDRAVIALDVSVLLRLSGLDVLDVLDDNTLSRHLHQNLLMHYCRENSTFASL